MKRFYKTFALYCIHCVENRLGSSRAQNNWLLLLVLPGRSHSGEEPCPKDSSLSSFSEVTALAPLTAYRFIAYSPIQLRAKGSFSNMGVPDLISNLRQRTPSIKAPQRFNLCR